jgi:hypothetical protein
MVGLMSLVGLVFSCTITLLQAAESTHGCAATAKIAAAEAQVAASEGTIQLRARISEASKAASAAEMAEGRRERNKHCIDALLAYADLAPDVFGVDIGKHESTWARRLAVEMSLQNGPYVVSPRVPGPLMTPEQQWERRRRNLIGHTAASGVFTGIGILLMTVPWITLAAACGPEEFCEGYEAIWLSGFGAPIFVASVIPLGIWSSRLHNHMRSRPIGLSIFDKRVRAQFSGPFLRLDF